jgi:hypothetical protein
MYFYPNPAWFHPAEFFPKSLVSFFDDNQIWRLMDYRILWTVEALRKRFGIMYLNNWLWGGNSQYRVYRPIQELIELNKRIYSANFSLTSQHCFGRAIDCHFRNYTVDEVREDIRKNQNREEYKYITRVEEKVDWLHFDCASWNRNKYGIFFFDP